MISLSVLCGLLAVVLLLVFLKLRSTMKSRDEVSSAASSGREDSPLGILVVESSSGRISYANPAAARMIGAERNALSGGRLADFTPGPTSEPGIPDGPAVFGSEEKRHLFVTRTKENPAGETTLYLTGDEQRAASVGALEDLEARYLAVLDRAPAIVYTTDPETGETTRDGGWLEALPGTRELPVNAEDDGPLREFRSSLRNAEEEQNQEKREIEYRAEVGRGRTLRLREEAWVSGGDPGFVRGVIFDVTAEREAAEALSVISGLKDAVYSATETGMAVRSGGRLFDVNPAGAVILGATQESVSGRTYLDIVHPDHERLARAGVRRTDRGDAEEENRMVWRREGGGEVPVEVRAIPVRYADDPNAALLLFEDVSGREREKERTRLEREASAQENARLRESVRSASKNLEAKIAVLRGVSSSGRDRELDAALKELDLAAAEISGLSGTGRGARRDDVDLSEIFRSLSSGRGGDAESGRNVEVMVAGGLVAPGDRPELLRAMTSLLENARQAAMTSPRPRVVVGRVERSGRPVFFVRDNGSGFDMADAGKLFDPQTSPANRSYDLPTAARIIERHGGHIWAESEPGRGATLYFTL